MGIDEDVASKRSQEIKSLRSDGRHLISSGYNKNIEIESSLTSLLAETWKHQPPYASPQSS